MAAQVTERPRRLLLSPSSSLSTMILYLLFPALLLGVVESQTANVTEEELSKVEGNLTFSESAAVNSTMKPDNMTSSLYKDEKSQLEDKLQSNQTSAVVTEDEEVFQNQEYEFPGRRCHREMLLQHSHHYCGTVFQMKMLSISPEKWCMLKNIISSYNSMTLCLENLSNEVGCYYPHPAIQDFFVHIHSYYFQNCSRVELVFEDPPHGLVIALTLIPVSLIPVLVYLVFCKSKVHE